LSFTEWIKVMLPTKVEVVAKELGISSAVPPQHALLDALENHRWFENERVVEALQPLMSRLCAHYLITERATSRSTQTLDRVRVHPASVLLCVRARACHNDLINSFRVLPWLRWLQVANFHLGNGAYVHGINWMADLAPLRLSESASLMANYKYPSPNASDMTTSSDGASVASSAYLREGVIKVSSDVEALLRDH
jgi:hypothetical protein